MVIDPEFQYRQRTLYQGVRSVFQQFGRDQYPAEGGELRRLFIDQRFAEVALPSCFRDSRWPGHGQPRCTSDPGACLSRRELLLAGARYRLYAQPDSPYVVRAVAPNAHADADQGPAITLQNHLDHRTLLQPIDHLPDHLVADTSAEGDEQDEREQRCSAVGNRVQRSASIHG